MANQYNAAFSHPNFILADYLYKGNAVNFSPYPITYNNLSYDTVLKTYKHRIFYSTTQAVFHWDATGNIQWGGSSPIQLSFWNDIAVYPFWDFINMQLIIAARHGGLTTFRILAMTYQSGMIGDTGYLSMPDDFLGDTYLRIFARSNNGDGSFNISCYAINVKHGINVQWDAFNYVPLGNPYEWYSRASGLNSDWGQSILKAYYLATGPFVLPSSIPSVGAFGSPSVIGTVGQGVTPYGINSGEAFGAPTVISNNSPVYPYGIASGEAFGSPTIVRTTTIYSSLPPAVPALEGDIRLDFNVYNQYGEFILADRDVERDPGFETAVLITLGTDKYAEIGDPLPDDSAYRGGSWMDSVPPVPEYKMGTKLWLLQRSKTLNEIPAMAKEYLSDGFQWMIDDGIVESIGIVVERRRDLNNTLAFTLAFVKPEGQTLFYKFFYNWEAQILRRQ